MTDDNQQAPQRRVIRVFPEYSRDWPLWESSTPTWDVGYTTTPETYCLSPELTQAIKVWNSYWETHFDPFEQWDAPESQEWWRTEGERVVALLRIEVVAFADVEYEPWPVES